MSSGNSSDSSHETFDPHSFLTDPDLKYITYSQYNELNRHIRQYPSMNDETYILKLVCESSSKYPILIIQDCNSLGNFWRMYFTTNSTNSGHLFNMIGNEYDDECDDDEEVIFNSMNDEMKNLANTPLYINGVPQLLNSNNEIKPVWQNIIMYNWYFKNLHKNVFDTLGLYTVTHPNNPSITRTFQCKKLDNSGFQMVLYPVS